MDIWVLDKTLEANDIVDTFNSLIWTDRYDEYGDFEIYTSVTDQALSLLQMDYYLQSRSSEHVMIIEEVLIDTDPENGNSVTIRISSFTTYRVDSNSFGWERTGLH